MSNYLKNIAIVGATGQQGKHIVAELLKTGKHTVTAVSREDSNTTPASGVKIAKVNYEKLDTLVSALKGQDALIITMNVTAPPDTSTKLIEAAAKAGVPWVLPDEWGHDTTKIQYGKEIMLGPAKVEARTLIEKLGVSSWIGVAGGFWYEYSLGTMKDMFGFDLQKKEVTFIDGGTVRQNISTWEQVAKAVAALMSMKIMPEGANDAEPSLDKNFRNKFAYVSSFLINQKDMFESLKRVTDTTDANWTIDSENSQERYAAGKKALGEGNRLGFVKALYARSFYPGEDANFEKDHGLANDVLGLPKEDLDTCTRGAIERSDQMSAAGGNH